MYKWGHELCSLIYSWIKILIIKWPKTQTIDKFEQKKRKEKGTKCYSTKLLLHEISSHLWMPHNSANTKT
jgi:hypothetical protein